MRSIQFLFAALLLQLSAFSFISVSNFADLPSKSVVIKAAGANDVNAFFSTTKVIAFHIYKAGSSEELEAMVKKLRESAGVEQVIQGKTTGDYTGINVTLKEVKNKSYWIELFRNAGFSQIKINNSDPVPVEKF